MYTPRLAVHRLREAPPMLLVVPASSCHLPLTPCPPPLLQVLAWAVYAAT